MGRDVLGANRGSSIELFELFRPRNGAKRARESRRATRLARAYEGVRLTLPVPGRVGLVAREVLGARREARRETGGWCWLGRLWLATRSVTTLGSQGMARAPLGRSRWTT